MPSVTRLYTVEDVRAFPDDGNRYETIEGELFVTPAPGTRHQEVLARLFLLLGTYVKYHRLGKLWFAPTDVVFGPLTLVEPDMLFIRADRAGIITPRDVQGAPDLAVEVLSPSTTRTDRGRKRALYQHKGVAEYWVVDTVAGQIEVWRPGDLAAAVERERLTWRPDPAVEPLEVALAELFAP